MTRPRRVRIRIAALALGAVLAAAAARGSTGGPDAFGYTWEDRYSGCPATVPSFGPTTRTMPDVTSVVGPIALGFTMPYYGFPVSEVWISPTGYVTFSDQGPAAGPAPMPSAARPNGVFAAHWTPVVDATLRFESLPDRFHLQWLQTVDPARSAWLTDLVITPDGRFHVKWVSPALLPTLTIGHEDAAGTRGRTVYRDGSGENGFSNPGTVRSLCVEPPTLLDCALAQELRCGESLAATLPAAGHAAVYGCSPLAYPGNEQVFWLDLPAAAAVDVSIDAPGLDVLQILNPPCSEDACVAKADQVLSYSMLFAGRYWFVVDQAAAGGGTPFAIDVACSNPFTPVACGERRSDDTTGRAPALDDHSCAAVPLSGPERLYQLTLPTDTSLTVTLATAVPELWVVLYDESEFLSGSGTCVAAGRGGAGMPLARAGSYVVVVDGESGASGSYELLVECGRIVDCAGTAPINCLQAVTGDTTTGNNAFVSYSCSAQAMTARDFAWAFHNPVEQSVMIHLDASHPEQRVFLLSDCETGACRGFDRRALACHRLPPGDYWIVVDGPAGAEGPFELEVECSAVVPGRDLQVPRADTSGMAMACGSLDVSGSIDVTVSNLGLVAVLSPIEVVVFEDRSGNGLYGTGDVLLGVGVLGGGLPAGASRVVTIAVSGRVRYRDAATHVQVDPGFVISESVESNNVLDLKRSCEWRPPVGVFQPVVEWHWDRSTTMPRHVHVDVTPMVADVDLDGIPDVVVATGDEPLGFVEGVVRVLSGDDGRELWTAEDPLARVWSSSNLAVADLDGDGPPEIIAHSYVTSDPFPGDRLVALESDGTVRWRSQPFIGHPALVRGGGGASVADIDCDGRPEIVYGANVFNADGTYFWAPEPGGALATNDDGNLLDGSLSVAVDLDADGVLEVVAGPTAYKLDRGTIDPAYGVPRGRILWNNRNVADGFPAVGQFDSDEEPEIVVTAAGVVHLLEGSTGAIIWSRTIPLGGGGCTPSEVAGGPPTVADFDGDCLSEVGVAGADYYVVLETNGQVKWQADIVDCSSHRTASSVFDFDGDGAAEVAFMDERRLHIFSGTDGTELAWLPAASHTWQEMITIADVDADGSAEIVMPLNSSRGLNGVQVIGDADGNWVDTRRIWNQHAYHIDNVLDDASIPGPADGCEAPSWLDHGTYRDQLGTAIFTAPDLTLTIVATNVIGGTDCDRLGRTTVRVGNAGGVASGSAGDVWFYDGDPDAGGTVVLIEPLPDLAPGAWMDLTVDVALVRVGILDLHVKVDGGPGPRGAIDECREDNNRCNVSLDNPPFPGGPPLQVGPALRATGHNHPDSPQIEGNFNWLLDAGLPRPAGDHYHVLRSTDPRTLTRLALPEPYVALTYTDVTPRTADRDLPLVHFLKVIAADRCEQEETP